jgi:hypothetical protein
LETTIENKVQMKLVYDLAKIVKDEYFEYIYRGNFTPTITENILTLTESKFSKDEETFKIRKRISYIMIECLQNITRHQDHPETDSGKDSGLFVLQRTKYKVFVTTGNVIKTDKKDKLEKHIQTITNLNAGELKEYYQKVLADGDISEKGGAGLGLISMARRTGGHLSYRFDKIDNTYSYYYLQNEIPFENIKNEPDPSVELASLDRISKYHTILNKQNILLNFNGAFAYDRLESILPIVESHPIETNENKVLAFDLSVKLLKNIIFFADSATEDEEETIAAGLGNRGIFLLSKHDDTLFLTSGNYILNSKAQTLKNKIELINQTSPESLGRLYKYLSEFFEPNESAKPDLSLFEMKLKSKNNLFYSFTPAGKSRSFFTIQIVI